MENNNIIDCVSRFVAGDKNGIIGIYNGVSNWTTNPIKFDWTIN